MDLVPSFTVKPLFDTSEFFCILYYGNFQMDNDWYEDTNRDLYIINQYNIFRIYFHPCYLGFLVIIAQNNQHIDEKMNGTNIVI